MSIPLFSDIGKQVKDLFEKNFYFDSVKLEMKNSLTSIMTYQGSQKYSIKDGKMIGELEGKYENDGIKFNPKISTESSSVSAELKVERAEFKGVNWIASGSFNPHDGKKSMTLGLHYKGPEYNFELASLQNDPQLKATGNLFRATGVINLFGWLFGGQMILDPGAGKMIKSQVVGGFQDGRCSFFVVCDPQAKQVSGSVFNLINPNIQTGLIYTLGGNSHSGGGGGGGQGDKDAQPSLAFCANYYLNSGATVKARINADYMLGLAYILKIKEGISITICTEVDAQKLKQGGHKIGFGIEFS
ncbi:hypothetical protein RDWZM_005353 [Blomia tropicalis]|uniref:Uncharacterized protein n=1 Tax=Blomia tropicalis TaxID=40697 RepID=A0A9Q0M567_BLOTA|nr:hypothetical protein RDWZM_005353 [Blomia tropicalis]